MHALGQGAGGIYLVPDGDQVALVGFGKSNRVRRPMFAVRIRFYHSCGLLQTATTSQEILVKPIRLTRRVLISGTAMVPLVGGSSAIALAADQAPAPKRAAR